MKTKVSCNKIYIPFSVAGELQEAGRRSIEKIRVLVHRQSAESIMDCTGNERQKGGRRTKRRCCACCFANAVLQNIHPLRKQPRSPAAGLAFRVRKVRCRESLGLSRRQRLQNGAELIGHRIVAPAWKNRIKKNYSILVGLP